MGCLCGHEEEGSHIDVYPPVPAPAKDVFEENRNCRDVLFLLLFLAFWAGMFYVGGTAFQKGDPNRIIYGLDSRGNLCGQKNSGVNGTDGPDFTMKKRLYWLDYRDILDANITSTKRVCVADCPSNSTEFVCAYDSNYNTDYFDNLTIAGKLNSALGSGPCYPALLPSVSVLNKCFPQPPPALTEFVAGAVNASAAAPSPSVTANETVDFQFVAQMAANLSKNKLQAYISDLIKAWLVVLVCGVGGGVLFSVLWIGILRFCAGVMAWASILLVNLALIGITLFCYAKAGKIPGQELAQHFNSNLPSALDPSDSDKKVFLVVAYVMTALSVVMFIITLVLFRRIRIAVACLKVGSQAVAAMPLLMLFPLLPFALLLALIAYWVAVAAFLYSAGDIVHASDGSYSIVWDTTLRYMAIFHLFGLLWTWQFIAGLGYMVVAGAVASFYWCRGDRSRVPRCPIATALKRTLCYYLGSIAFGSLIVAIVQFVRILLEWVDRKARAAAGAAGWVKYVMGCLRCVLWLVEKIVKFINKNAYIMVAVKGTGYCDSAGRAVTLMVGNALRVAAVNTVGGSLLWVGKIAVAALCGGFAFLMCDLPMYVDADRASALSSPLFPVLFTAVFAYFIAAVFMNVYEMAIDTILLCFCEDCERNDGTAQYAPPLLLSALGKSIHKEGSIVPTAPAVPGASSPGFAAPPPPGLLVLSQLPGAPAAVLKRGGSAHARGVGRRAPRQHDECPPQDTGRARSVWVQPMIADATDFSSIRSKNESWPGTGL